jgi:flavin reductase (NADH)
VSCVSAEKFRQLMSRFPTGVAVVTSLDLHGLPRGMTCSSLASVCLNPPTLLVCLRTGSATYAAVQRHGAFAVNLLHAGGRGTAELFAAPIVNRFAQVRWRSSGNGLPWLVDDAAAIADCRVVRSVPAGDHTVVLGELIELGVGDDIPPLLYGMRRYAEWNVDATLPPSTT